MARVTARRHVHAQRWALVHIFVSDPSRWLPLPATVLGGVGWRSTVHGGPLLQAVRVRLWLARDLPDAFSRHIIWEPGRHDRALARRAMPTLHGQLRLEHQHPSGAVLELDGNYRPPGGRAGDLLDVVALRRIADTTVERFLEEIADRMTAAAALTGRPACEEVAAPAAPPAPR